MIWLATSFPQKDKSSKGNHAHVCVCVCARARQLVASRYNSAEQRLTQAMQKKKKVT
jgi:hypothetical protein